MKIRGEVLPLLLYRPSYAPQLTRARSRVKTRKRGQNGFYLYYNYYLSSLFINQDVATEDKNQGEFLCL